MLFIALIACLLIIMPSPLISFLLPHETSQILHNHCLQLIPESVRFQQLNQALVCGASLHRGEHWQLLKDSGLLHLAIVSGSHLLLIAHVMQRITWRSRLLIPLHQITLILYVFATLANPPVVRAFLHINLVQINRRLGLSWNPGTTLALAGLLSLALNPKWSESWSLLLSWTAGLVVSGSISGPQGSTLKNCTLQYILLLPILSLLGDYHPQVILANWLLAPVLSLVMFPLALLLVPVPALSPIVDSAWSLLFALLKHGANLYDGSPSIHSYQTPPLLSWGYLMFLQSWSLRVRKV